MHAQKYNNAYLPIVWLKLPRFLYLLLSAVNDDKEGLNAAAGLFGRRPWLMFVQPRGYRDHRHPLVLYLWSPKCQSAEECTATTKDDSEIRADSEVLMFQSCIWFFWRCITNTNCVMHTLNTWIWHSPTHFSRWTKLVKIFLIGLLETWVQTS